MSENRLKFKCDCGYLIVGPVSQMLPLIVQHEQDPACSFAKKDGAA